MRLSAPFSAFDRSARQARKVRHHCRHAEMPGTAGTGDNHLTRDWPRWLRNRRAAAAWCADRVVSCGTPSSSSFSAAWRIVSQSEVEPMMMPTSGSAALARGRAGQPPVLTTTARRRSRVPDARRAVPRRAGLGRRGETASGGGARYFAPRRAAGQQVTTAPPAALPMLILSLDRRRCNPTERRIEHAHRVGDLAAGPQPAERIRSIRRLDQRRRILFLAMPASLAGWLPRPWYRRSSLPFLVARRCMPDRRWSGLWSSRVGRRIALRYRRVAAQRRPRPAPR